MLKKLLLVVVGLVASIGMAIAAVNINTATEQELQTLPGVGDVRAKAIVDYRKANGNFKSVDDLKNVKGIGDTNFAKLKSEIAVSGATTVSAPPAKVEKKETVKEAAKDAKKEVKADAKAAAAAVEKKTEKAGEVVKEKAKDAKEEVKADAKAAKGAAKSAAAVVEDKAEKAGKKVKSAVTPDSKASK